MCEQCRRDGVVIGDASYDVHLSLQNGWSPLMVAALRSNFQCLQLLLDKGADVNQQNQVSSFHYEMRSFALVMSCSLI